MGTATSDAANTPDEWFVSAKQAHPAISAARGARWTLVLGTLVISGAYIGRIFTSENLITITAGATLCSVGTGLVYSALPTLVLDAVHGRPDRGRDRPERPDADNRPVALQHRNRGRADPVDHGTHHGTAVPTLRAYQVAFGLAAAAALGAAIVTLGLPKPTPLPKPAAKPTP
ncbi:hypothetical protein ACU686_16055 [Yinghuangia aomiensis]